MRSLLSILLCLSFLSTFAQLTINEVCADNESIIADEEGDYEDWIELYNSGNTAINLNNYLISDNPDLPNKWSFPNVEIPANGFLLLYASGNDLIGQELHTNFKISKDGETLVLLSPEMEIIDELVIPPLEEDHSFGRQPDGSNEFNFFYDPSPGLSNNTALVYNFANPPQFNNTQFFSTENILVELSCDQADCVIYYTMDGSIPDENALLYTEPFEIDSNTVIRASSLTPSLLLSNATTRTFFIRTSHELPIVAISTEPKLLWDADIGLFMPGPEADSLYPFFGANFWSDTEIPLYFEYFKNEDLKIEYPLGAKIHGGRGARTRPMKPLRLLAKESYGTRIMDYPFFENRTNTKFKRLVLRNSSGDFNVCHMRDEFLARYFINESLNIDAIAEQPVVVYINGAYYGLMHLREKVDEYYLHYNYNIDPDQIDILEEDTAILHGNFDLFDQHESFVINNDLSETSSFDIAASYFDVESLCDYVICQTFVNNMDWPSNNLKYWRAKTEDAKWRYLLFDMDIAMARQGWSKASINSFEDKMGREDVRMVVIFKAFLENESFRHYFINRYADLMNTTFRTEVFNEEIFRSRDEIDVEMQRHVPHWGKSYNNWYTNEIPKLNKFANERPMYARQFIQDYFNLASQDQIEVNVFPQQAGALQINTISISKEQLPWDGVYFHQIPIQLSVIPEPGFIFSHWESSYSGQIISTNLTTTVNPQDGETFIAVFEHAPIFSELTIYPNPATDQVSLIFNSPEPDNFQVDIYDTIGRRVFTFSDQIVTTGDNTIKLNISTLDDGAYIISFKSANFSTSKKFIKLRNTQ